MKDKCPIQGGVEILPRERMTPGKSEGGGGGGEDIH